MKYFKYITLVTLLNSTSILYAGDVQIPAQFNTLINQELATTKDAVLINQEALTYNKNLIRKWVAGSFDISKAKVRESKIFKRKTFQSDIQKDTLRFPKERFIFQNQNNVSTPFNVVPNLNINTLQMIQLTQPLKILYKEGDGYFKFQKLKEGLFTQTMNQDLAIKSSKDFILENKFIREETNDKIDKIIVLERRINQEDSQGKVAKDYIVQQDVIFERSYQGKPVLNSKVILGLQPKSGEILSFKHFNWTPTETKTIPTKSVKNFTPIKKTEEFKSLLTKRLNRDSQEFKNALVKDVVFGWFQTKTALYPIVGVEVDVTFESKAGKYVAPYFEMFNLAGSDTIFDEDYKQAPEMPQQASR